MKNKYFLKSMVILALASISIPSIVVGVLLSININTNNDTNNNNTDNDTNPNDLFIEKYSNKINNINFDTSKAILAYNGWNKTNIDVSKNLNYIDNWLKNTYHIDENNYSRLDKEIKITNTKNNDELLNYLFNTNNYNDFIGSLGLDPNKYNNVDILLNIEEYYLNNNIYTYPISIQKIIINNSDQNLNIEKYTFDINKTFNINIYCDSIYPGIDGSLINIPKDEEDFNLNDYLINNVFNIYIGSKSGTCSSFYIDVDNDKKVLNWYLLTNFHVAYDALTLYNNEQIVKTGLMCPYITKANDKYIKVMRLKPDGNMENIADTDSSADSIHIDDITIWTDCSPPNIPENSSDNLNLFSNKTSNTNERYNIDASLVQMTFNFDNLEKHPNFLNFFRNVSGCYNNYLKNKNLGKSNPYKENNPFQKFTAMGGFPYWHYEYCFNLDKLSNGYEMVHTYVGFKNNLIHFWMDWIKYKVTQLPELFQPGASGSPAWWYVFDNNDIINIEPVQYGIYFGNASYGNPYSPIIMALKTDLYNIYENFGEFLKIKDSLIL